MNNPQVGIISQARMTSTRLPGKVLLPIGQQPVLQYHLDRLQQSGYPVLLATTLNKTDDPLADFGREHQIPVYRGDEQNVLGRYYEAARVFKLDIIVRVTSDCPLIDGALIRQGIQAYLENNDAQLYLSNCLVRTFPRGFDFEIFSFALLEEAFLQARQAGELEHVTPYINQNKSGQVRFRHVTQPEDKSAYRVTLDTPEDLTLLRILIEDYQAHLLPARDICHLLDAHPNLAQINAMIEQKKV
jgi:spore coat polysaccharide biosynthesis protein SpsF